MRARVAEEVRSVLARRRMSGSELARKMGVSQAYVWRRLSAETSFDFDDLERIAEVLDVDPVAFIPRSTRPTDGTSTGYTRLTRLPVGRNIHSCESLHPRGLPGLTRLDDPLAAAA